jgi:hypothetical protein
MALTLDGTIGVSATGNLLAAGYMSARPVTLTSAIGNVYAGNIIANPSPVPSSMIVTGNATVNDMFVAAGGVGTVSVVGGGAAYTSGGYIYGGNASVGAGNITLGNVINNGAYGTGNIGSSGVYWNTVFAKATSAQYADLAEMYTADADYEPGTVLTHGGANEVTVSDQSHDTAILGVVSTNPSYLMNSGLRSEYATRVALVGRVPVRVVGTIRKGDCLVNSHIAGVATRLDPAKYQLGCVIGKAIDEYNLDIPGTIEAAVGSL